MSFTNSRSSSPSHLSENSSLSSSAGTPSADDLQAYHQLMSSIFPSECYLELKPSSNVEKETEGGVETCVDQDGEKRPMTKAEKQNAKKKRRKDRERLAKVEEVEATREAKQTQDGDSREKDQSQVVEFRLFSSCPVKPISLLPEAEDYPLPTNPIHKLRSETEMARVRKAAQECAMDAVSFEGSFSNQWTKRQCPPLQMAFQNVPREPPDIFIGVLQSTGIPHTLVASRDMSKKEIPSVTLVHSDSALQRENNKSRNRRGHRRKAHFHAPPRFWAPPIGLGGKARGYALGYRDSAEGRRQDGYERYLRS
nr:hypothetical protein L203_01134 [Cryptococcus depauperatus CBS 7841]